jgi:hypothetical protein
VKEVSVFLAALHRAEAEVLNRFVLFDFNVLPTDHKMLSLATYEDTMEPAKSNGPSGRREADDVGKFTIT